jgi:hypothetical protein
LNARESPISAARELSIGGPTSRRFISAPGALIGADHLLDALSQALHFTIQLAQLLCSALGSARSSGGKPLPAFLDPRGNFFAC